MRRRRKQNHHAGTTTLPAHHEASKGRYERGNRVGGGTDVRHASKSAAIMSQIIYMIFVALCGMLFAICRHLFRAMGHSNYSVADLASIIVGTSEFYLDYQKIKPKYNECWQTRATNGSRECFGIATRFIESALLFYLMDGSSLDSDEQSRVLAEAEACAGHFLPLQPQKQQYASIVDEFFVEVVADLYYNMGVLAERRNEASSKTVSFMLKALEVKPLHEEARDLLSRMPAICAPDHYMASTGSSNEAPQAPDRYLLYEPQYGVDNQIVAIVEAMAWAKILGRRLVLPPIFLPRVSEFTEAFEDWPKMEGVISFSDVTAAPGVYKPPVRFQDWVKLRLPVSRILRISREAVFDTSAAVLTEHMQQSYSQHSDIETVDIQHLFPQELIASPTDIKHLLGECNDTVLAFSNMFFANVVDSSGGDKWTRLAEASQLSAHALKTFRIVKSQLHEKIRSSEYACYHVRLGDFVSMCDTIEALPVDVKPIHKLFHWHLLRKKGYNCLVSADEAKHEIVDGIPALILSDDASIIDKKLQDPLLYASSDWVKQKVIAAHSPAVDGPELDLLVLLIEQELCAGAKYTVLNKFSTFSQRVASMRNARGDVSDYWGTFQRKRWTNASRASIGHVLTFTEPRTASTVQFNLLCVASFLHFRRYHPNEADKVKCFFGNKYVVPHRDTKHVQKTHTMPPYPSRPIVRNSTTVFTTAVTRGEAAASWDDLDERGYDVGFVQDLDTLADIGIVGLVKVYSEIFGLTRNDRALMIEYFELWEKLRVCCGLQMSKSWRYELNNTAVPEGTEQSHPYCSTLDIDITERHFMGTRLYKLIEQHRWVAVANKPSNVDMALNGTYCSSYNAAVQREGLTFNRYPAADRKTAAEEMVEDLSALDLGHDFGIPEFLGTDWAEMVFNEWETNDGETIESENAVGTREDVALKVAHLYPVYKVEDCFAPFCPYNQDQSVAIASLKRAHDHSKEVDVVHVVSVFPEDEEVVPDGFVRLANLIRSTASEYPGIGALALPFFQDMFRNLRASPDFETFDYVIFTNSDIIVHEEFYDTVASIIHEKKLDAFTINRLTVNKTKPGTEDLYTASDLQDIYKLIGDVHPGSDCFIMNRSIFERIEMENFFLANALSANHLLLRVEGLAQDFRMFESHELNITFHLGDDRNWEKWDSLEKISYELACNNKTVEDVMKICTFGVSDCLPDVKEIHQLRYLTKVELDRRQACTIGCYRMAGKLRSFSFRHPEYFDCPTCSWDRHGCQSPVDSSTDTS